MTTRTEHNGTHGLSGAVVLITGALTGIGRATAFAFAQEGSKLVVSGRRQQEGPALAAELRSMGTEAEFIYADVRREEEIKSLVEGTVARFGRLDIAVNNAGVEGKPGPVTEQTAENYAATFETNVLGVLLSMKHELLVMKAQGHGSIVNVSSTLGIRGGSGALEVASLGIRVNAVAPGPIDTAMFDRFAGSPESKERTKAKQPVGRLGKPEEVANIIVYVGSNGAPFLTGQSVIIDGGRSL